jgi:hypothetical protein
LALKDEPKREYDAKRCLSQALAIPDAEKTVIAWSQKHPEFCPLLVDFVKQGIVRADDLVGKIDKDDREREVELDSELRKPGYDLCRQALLLAEKLDPTSLKTQYLLAKTDEVFGQFQTSYDRLSGVINSLMKDSSSDESLLLFSRHVRGRVAFLLVEQQREQGDRTTEQTAELLKGALRELGLCSRRLGSAASSAHDLKDYRFTHDLLRATLNLAEVEMDLGRPDEAGEKLRASTKLMAKLKEKAGWAGLEPSAVSSLARRLEKAYERLKSNERIASSP